MKGHLLLAITAKFIQRVSSSCTVDHFVDFVENGFNTVVSIDQKKKIRKTWNERDFEITSGFQTRQPNVGCFFFFFFFLVVCLFLVRVLYDSGDQV